MDYGETTFLIFFRMVNFLGLGWFYKYFFNFLRPGGHDDQAHPPIHPTKWYFPVFKFNDSYSVSLETLANDQERNIYELVTRHFIASCSQVHLTLVCLTNIPFPGRKRKSNDTQYHGPLSRRRGISRNWINGGGEKLVRCLFEMGEVDWKQGCNFSNWRHICPN